MKIGIVSTQFTINYGAVLQAYSLSNFISELDFVSDIEMINYQPKSPRYGNIESYSFSSLKSTVVSFAKLLNVFYRNARKTKIHSFDVFTRNEFNLGSICFSNAIELAEENFIYDFAIVGSDQVWNPKVIKDDVFYLKFLNCHKLSYAASLGGTVDEKSLQNLSQNIKSFKAISLREAEGVEFLEKSLNRSIEVLIDPVFLSSKKHWLKIAKKSSLVLEGDYVLVYEVNSPSNFKSYVEELKKLFHIPIVIISTRSIPKYYGVKTISDAGPYDFLNLFSKASFILTSSFHGVAFSCILNKPFVCVLNDERSERQRNLLSLLGLTSNIMNSMEDLIKMKSTKTDWKNVNKIIKSEVDRSRNFLMQGFKNV